VLRNSVRKVEEAIASGDRNAALMAIKEAEPALMRAAQRGVVHRTTRAARCRASPTASPSSPSKLAK